MLELQRLKLIKKLDTEHQSPPNQSTNTPVNQQTQNMQNEPNFKNPQINLTPAKTKDYENKLTIGHRQNEPKTNPLLPSNLSDEDWASLKAFAKKEKKTQFMKKQNKTAVA